MTIIRKIIGAKSIYEKDLPYAYEARVTIMEGGEDYNSYISDTICSLVEQLGQNAITPDEVEIFEVFQNEEKGIDSDRYTDPDGKWLVRKEMCQSFSKHYDGHIYPGGCTFQDREFVGVGPKKPEG